ncbi:MAG: hypothetical protein JWQ27_2511 [Ferruginibacter sp.]|nr:hypothetical protein [Ferruginibacter sp.]
MKGKMIALGIAFAFFWASASTATKIALQSAQPFVIAVSRFFIAGLIMLLIAHVIMKKPLPAKSDWRKIMIYGLLNVSIYLGLYIIAMQHVSAGLGTLAVGVNPVLISFMSAFFFKKRITVYGYGSLLCCAAGVCIAAYPLLLGSYASVEGIAIILLSMLAYSGGAIYYAKSSLNRLDILTVNGWQTIFGCIFLLPFLFYSFRADANQFDAKFWGGTLWLAIPVSIGAVQCWMRLLKYDAAKAAFWLFLCPLFGFFIAKILLAEPLSWFTALGVLLVIAGLWMAQRFKISK